MNISSVRRGITLVELLITMAIMAIIAALVLGLTAAAMDSARVRRTQSTIAKIHTLIMERYASYETRRVDVDPSILQALNKWASEAATPQEFRMRSVLRGKMMADARLLGLRELMKMEMPERWGDVTYTPQILSQAPPLNRVYLRRYQQTQVEGVDLHPNQFGECLYMVVMEATGDGEARTHFTNREIGDADGDGAYEFHDAWGKPITWLRWPAGVVSPLQPQNADGSRPDADGGDPFDPFKRDSPEVVSPPLAFYPQVGPRNGNFQKVYHESIRRRLELSAGGNMPHLRAFKLTPWICSTRGRHRYFIYIPAEEALAAHPLDPYMPLGDGQYQNGVADADFVKEYKANITNHGMGY